MREFRAFTDNLAAPLVGKVTGVESAMPPGSISLRFEPDESPDAQGLAESDDSPRCPASPMPLFQITSSVLTPGDVVLIEPGGRGTVLFEKSSSHNAVLLTEQCNSSCIVCPQPPKRDKTDLVSLALRVIALLDPDTQSLGITGGEPTLMWKGLVSVLRVCAERIPAASLHLLTNGRVFKNYDRAEEIAEEGGGRLLVAVPLYADVDSLHDRIVGQEGAFWETVAGIHNLERAGVPVEIRTVLTSLNHHRLSRWFEFVYRSFPFARHVVFVGIEAVGSARENIDDLWIEPSDFVGQLAVAVRGLHRRGIPVSIYGLPLCTLPPVLWSFSRRAISDWKCAFAEGCGTCAVATDCGGAFRSTLDSGKLRLRQIPAVAADASKGFVSCA